MAIPSNRTPVRVARGAAVKFTETIDGVAGAGAKALEDGEIVWDETNEKFQLKVGGSSSTTLKDHTVDTTNLAPKASPTFTGTVAIPNIANLETAVTANTAKVTNVTTNLSVTANGTSLTVESSDGTNASIPAATTSEWGAMTDEDKTKLNGITTGANALLSADQTWTGSQRGALEDLTLDGTDLDTDFNLSNNFQYTMGGNYTLAQPTNQTAGQSGSIFLTQDGAGNRTLGYHADWKWAGGTQPTLSTAANAVDRIDYTIAAANKIHAVMTLDVK